MVRRRRPDGAGRTIAVGWSTPEDDPPPAPGHGPSTPEEPRTHDPAPERPGARRPLLLGGAIALVLALVLVLPPLLVGGGTAEQAAAHYLRAVLDGDAQTVREHLAPQEGVLDIALTDAILAAAPERADSFTIDRVSIDGDSAEVTVSLTRRDRSLESTLQLERERQGLLRRPHWVVQPVTLPVLRLEIPVGSEHLMINGQEVRIPEEHRPEGAFDLSPLLLHGVPGMFEVSAQEVGDHLAPVPVLVDAPPLLDSWVSPPATIGYELTEAGMDQMGAQLEEPLQECLSSSSPRPAGCPFAAPQEVTGSGTWEMQDPLEIRGSWSEGSIYSVHVTGTVAFTPDAEEGTSTQTHQVEIDTPAFAVLDRDGRLTPEWITHDMVSADCDDGETAVLEWSAESGSVICESTG